MKIKLILSCFIIIFLIASCSSKYQDNSYGIKITEEESNIIINSYSTLEGLSAVEQAPFVVYEKNNDYFDVKIINSNASCSEVQLDKIRIFFDKATDNKPSLIKLKYAIRINLLPSSKFNIKRVFEEQERFVDFYFPFVSCDDLDRLNTIYYLMIHELKHVDLIITGGAKDVSIIDNEYIATKSSNCTLITNQNFNSIEIFEVTDTDLNDLIAYKNNNVGNPSQLGAMIFHYEASKVSGIGLVMRGTRQHDALIRWCNE